MGPVVSGLSFICPDGRCRAGRLGGGRMTPEQAFLRISGLAPGRARRGGLEGLLDGIEVAETRS
jgi:hypothetical protein